MILEKKHKSKFKYPKKNNIAKKERRTSKIFHSTQNGEIHLEKGTLQRKTYPIPSTNIRIVFKNEYS